MTYQFKSGLTGQKVLWIMNKPIKFNYYAVHTGDPRDWEWAQFMGTYWWNDPEEKTISGVLQWNDGRVWIDW